MAGGPWSRSGGTCVVPRSIVRQFCSEERLARCQRWGSEGKRTSSAMSPPSSLLNVTYFLSWLLIMASKSWRDWGSGVGGGGGGGVRVAGSTATGAVDEGIAVVLMPGRGVSMANSRPVGMDAMSSRREVAASNLRAWVSRWCLCGGCSCS